MQGRSRRKRREKGAGRKVGVGNVIWHSQRFYFVRTGKAWMYVSPDLPLRRGAASPYMVMWKFIL